MSSETVLTLDEVAKHAACIIIGGKAYNVDSWMHSHPGGKLVISNMLGKDCTEAFHAFHAPSTQAMLKAFYMGKVVDAPQPSPMESEFNQLRAQLLDQGFFQTSPWMYAKRLLKLGCVFALALLLSVQSSVGLCLTGALLMGLFWQQLAFIGHDAGHASITGRRLFDLGLGILLGNALGGVSIGWWKRSHNVHHSLTNSVEHDPDIQHLPFVAISDELLRPFYSTYHRRMFQVNVISQFFVRRQHYLYYVIMAFARWNLYVQSILHVLRCPDMIPMHALEVCSLLAFYAWQGVLVSRMASVYHAVLWLLISNGACGILHVQITLSHFAMEAHNIPQASNWIASQLGACMNIECSSYMDWFHGGLQFQIEHHLFPRIPSYKLRKVRDHVKAFALKWSLPYHETGFIDANKKVLASLKKVAVSSHMLADLLYARG